MSETTRVAMFATPSRDSHVSVEYDQSKLATDRLFRANGIRCAWGIVAGDNYLANARNHLATSFLAHAPATDLFFIDDDVGWNPEDALSLVLREDDVVAGVYQKKCLGTVWPVDIVEPKIIRDGLWLTERRVPTGFMRIRRNVIERLAEVSPTYWHVADDGTAHRRIGIFEMGATDAKGSEASVWATEDFAFCQKWRSLGGEIWIDPRIRLTHRGSFVWTANLLDETL